jgi:hypothetical protein
MSGVCWKQTGGSREPARCLFGRSEFKSIFRKPFVTARNLGPSCFCNRSIFRDGAVAFLLSFSLELRDKIKDLAIRSGRALSAPMTSTRFRASAFSLSAFGC